MDGAQIKSVELEENGLKLALPDGTSAYFNA